MDSSRIRRELGFAPPVALPDALERTIEWARATPSAPPDYGLEDAVLARLRR
jgi:hypothetical protein